MNGWFEWRPENGKKHPYWIRPEETEVFSLAGIWEGMNSGPGSSATFAILTTEAAPGIADIHHRQPVILDDEAVDRWLDPGWGREEFIAMARRGCEFAYDRRRVTRKVNDPLNGSRELLEPVETREATAAAIP